jgi:hypothetical protein
VPYLLGYNAGTMGHLVVVTDRDDATGLLRVMNPWFPDPSSQGIDVDLSSDQGYYTSHKTGQTVEFDFSGGIEYKYPSFYAGKPLGSSGKLFIVYRKNQ